MAEVPTGRPETETAKTNVIAFESARQKRQAGEKSQRQRPLTPPPSPEVREERDSARRQQHIREELTRTGGQPKGDNAEQQPSGAPEDRRLFDEIFGGQTEEQINAHNEQFKARSEKEQAEKERLHEEVREQYARYQEHLAAMTPEEREAYERRIEKIREGMKPLTREEWTQLFRTWAANMKRGERERAAWIAERDPRYDPMTGDLLESDEFPLDAAAEYYFDGKTRPRRFIPPDSLHLKDYKQLQFDEEEPQVPENESNERLVKRLTKAGFTEVEPTRMDKALFEKTQWFRNLSPEARMQFLQNEIQEMTQGRPWNKESASGEIIQALMELIYSLLGVDVEEEEKREESTQKAA